MIPTMTDPMGRYWRQPSRDEILVDEHHAVMDASALDALAEYSCTVPTGVYVGKMWKRRKVYSDKCKEWLLCWFGPSDKPEHCSIEVRPILLLA